MATVASKPPAGIDGLGQTHRTDRWWVAPLLTALGLGVFGIYATFRAFFPTLVDPVGYFQYGHGAIEPYIPLGNDPSHSYLLSPLFSPLLVFPFLPAWITPAIFILWAPGGFRLTCYYYRKAYYRAFFADPPGCAVGEGRKSYQGETRLFLFQNLHRYFLYVALIFLVILLIDAFHAALWPNGNGGLRLGVSVGTIVLLTNVLLLGLYTFSCHSFRHLVGGNVNCYSCARFGSGRYQAWKQVSLLNKYHMHFAWVSLFWVGFTDLYVWMVASGRWTDLRFI